MGEPILVGREGAVLVLSNNNPAARNALTPEFYAALPQALAQAEADPSIGAVVLTGVGGHFLRWRRSASAGIASGHDAGGAPGQS
ncbi:enoyl-CoA hydratase-related protein [Pseudomonas [fluorescens] ATCC 17400]